MLFYKNITVMFIQTKLSMILNASLMHFKICDSLVNTLTLDKYKIVLLFTISREKIIFLAIHVSMAQMCL